MPSKVVKFSGDLKDHYEEWLKSKGITHISEYCGPINQQYFKGYFYGDIFTFLLSHGYLDWVDRVLEELRIEYISHKSTNTYYSTIAEFLKTKARYYEYKSDIKNLQAGSKKSNPKLYANYPSFYGTEPLLEILNENNGSPNNIFKKKTLIEDIFRYSYFFDPQAVHDGFNKLCEMIGWAKKNQDKLKDYIQKQKNKDQWEKLKKTKPYIQISQKILYARGNKHSRPEVIALKDRDGNRAVKNLIEKNFGYHTSGPSRNFYDYTISHLWGKANDPFFFTNLCNLALIPNWINHLMDKIKPEDTLYKKKREIFSYHQKRSKIVNTILAVAFTVYDIDKLISTHSKKGNENLKISDFLIDTRFVEEGSFTINIIAQKGNPNQFDEVHGRIVKLNITIEKKSNNGVQIRTESPYSKEYNVCKTLYYKKFKESLLNQTKTDEDTKKLKKYQKTINF